MNISIVTLITNYLAASIRMATPLTLAGIGEAISEKAGIMNIGLEAIMLLGAFCSFIVAFFTGNLFLGLLAGVAGGIVVSMVHGFLSIQCKVNQTIVGLALNFTILGVTSFFFLVIFGQSTELPVCDVLKDLPIPVLSQIPVLQIFFNQSILAYLAFACVILVCFVFYHTEWGVRLHAVGEHPRAADTAGINVFATRYMACLLNGLLGGLAGSYSTLVQLGFFMENITAGKGYIAMVTVILGRRNPVGIFLASLMIGFTEALQYNMQTLGFPVPSQVFTMLPYVAAVLVLIFSIGKNTDPAGLGVPYVRNSR